MAIELSAQPRTVTGKKVKTLRRQAIIPIVIYGAAVNEPINAQVDEKALGKTLHQAGSSHLIYVVVGGRRVPVLARDVQHDQMTKRIIHVDFQAVNMSQPVHVTVPVRLVGTSSMVEGGTAILNHTVDTVEIQVLPNDLVGHLDLDITPLVDLGTSLTVADLVVPANITVLTAQDVLLATLSPLPTSEEIEGDAIDTAAAEGGAETGEDEQATDADEE